MVVGHARHEGMLDDYANMARAALILYEQDQDPALIDQAMAWIESSSAPLSP